MSGRRESGMVMVVRVGAKTCLDRHEVVVVIDGTAVFRPKLSHFFSIM